MIAENCLSVSTQRETSNEKFAEPSPPPASGPDITPRLLLLQAPALCFSQDFSARKIGSYGNVVVMEVTGNYDANAPNGEVNGVPRQIIANEFYKTYKDEYDFLAVFTNFDFKMPPSAVAFYVGIKNDVAGIGKPVTDNSSQFGSNSKLQGIVDMGNAAALVSDPMQKGFNFVLDTLEHELLHRWGSYAKFKASDASISSALLGKDGSHWSFLLDSRASVQYGNQWRDNGDGTFTSVAARKYYSPLDLYLMGMADKSEVPPMLLIENPDIDPARVSEVGVTISGTARQVTIDDIIAAEGERIPSPSTSQKSFKTAFILLTAPGAFTGDELPGIEAIRNEWIKRFSIHTDGRGIVQVALIPKEDIPVNPGADDPIVDPRSLPPSLAEGVKWLSDNQKPDGSWYDLADTAQRDTSEAVLALRHYSTAQGSFSSGAQWLAGTAAGNTDYLSRKIEIFKVSGRDTSALVDELLSRTNPDGGWGSDRTYVSNPFDTSFALRALSAVEYSGGDTIPKAIEYLKSKQNVDGGWGRDEAGAIEVTANVLRAFRRFKDQYPLQDNIIAGLAWLSQKQNPDGGFGNSPSTIYETAPAVLALQENNGPRTIITNGVNYILNLQAKDGSWYKSPHQTALAVAAAWAATVDPDLLIKQENISFVPSAIRTLPANIAINARVENRGRTSVSQARIFLYEGSISEATKIGEQSVAVAGESAAIVSFAASVNSGDEHRFYVVADPENLVAESDETNNQAYNTLMSAPTYDFEVLASDLSVSPDEAVIGHDVVISSKVANKGTMNAYNVPLRYTVDAADGSVEIATRNISIPAGKTISDQVVWKANRAGDNLPITVWADPLNKFSEESNTNNKASVPVTVWTASLEPDLSIKSWDIAFSPSSITALPSEVIVNARIANLGRTDVPQARAVLFDGPVSESTKAGEQFFAVSGQSVVNLSFPVTIKDGNEHRFYVQLDPEGLVAESDETNNLALNALKPETTYDLEVKTTDISISPNPAETTNDVTISAKISNKGTMNAYNVPVRFSIDDAGVTIDLATKTIDVPANSTVSTQIVWKADHAGANMPLTAWADPFNSFAELSEANNKASTQITVNSSKDPNLTISYRDITVAPASPNETGDARISSVVKNAGLTAANNVTVNFYRGAPGADGVLLGSQVIPAVNPGESSPVSFDWTNIKETGEKLIYLRVDPGNSIKETSEEDNDAFTTIKILSLPDLSVSSNSITFSPSAPKEGDTVSISVTVKNLGEQNAQNVSVKVSESGTLIGTQSVPLISGNSQAAATFSYDTTGKKGAHEISVLVDPDNAIVERGKENNRASKSLGVQDANLWVTEPYISPNGDGIKDSTQFFFRLKEAQTVQVAVVDEKGDTVRTFTGGPLDNTTGAGIDWDGRNDAGMVVDDGQYQLQVIGAAGTAGTMSVVVDNNRSPLTKAIGTKYLLNNNITCMLLNAERWEWSKYVDKWEWFPDESGILLLITYGAATPEYPSGLYVISPDGADVDRIVPWNWIGDPGDSTYVTNYQLSPDGEKVLFTTSRQSWTAVWVVDRDGANLSLLDSYENAPPKWYSTNSYGWFNNDHIIYCITYMADQSQRYLDEIYVMKLDGTGKTLIDQNATPYFRRSPDGAKIAYLNDNTLIVTDSFGNKKEIFNIGSYIIPNFEWLNETTLVAVKDNEQLFLIDINNYDGLMQLSNKVGEFSLYSQRTKIAYIDYDSLSVNIADSSGNIRELYTFKHDIDPISPTLVNLVWSNDGNKLAFVDRFYEKIVDEEWDGYNGFTVVIDLQNGKICSYFISSESVPIPSIVKQSSTEHNTFNLGVGLKFKTGSLKWLSDQVTLIGATEYEEASYSFALNTNDGKKEYLSISNIEKVSPFGHYFNYYKDADALSSCYDRGSFDIWAMSSLLNLTTELRAIKNGSAVILRGVAADLNFGGYKLEYADVNNTNTWNLVQPASDMPVYGDVFTTWIPPYEGRFWVKLTTWDRAGNYQSKKIRVFLDHSANITNLSKSTDLLSPNGDGVKDVVELHYKVLEPAHLEFNIVDKNDVVIRTYLKDHVSPGQDFIYWDGRNETGEIVPDGKYRIMIFNYEFFVEIDNTPPDVGLSLSEIQKEKAFVAAEIKGHVLDSKLKHWQLEYCEATNHEKWYPYSSGDFNVVVKDVNGQVELNDNGKAIDRYIVEKQDREIYQLLGKLFKITAEDYAGNKASYITEPLIVKEQLHIYAFDKNLLLPDDSICIEDVTKDVHSIDVFDTIQRHVNQLSIQYTYDGEKWQDLSALNNPETHESVLIFNRPEYFPAIKSNLRAVAADELENTYLSKDILGGCGGGGPPSPSDDRAYIDAYEAQCDLVSNQIFIEDWLISKLRTMPWIPISLDLYIRNQLEFQFLKHFDLSNFRAPWRKLAVDTSTLEEGIPEILVVLKYHEIGDNSERETSAIGSIIVDRVLPTSRITYPAPEMTICPSKAADNQDWSGIPIEVIASDNRELKPGGIKLFYAEGQNPSSWTPAMTWENGKRKPLTASENLHGQLGFWDVSDLDGSEYSLKLEVTDAAGNKSCSFSKFFIDKYVGINLSLGRSLISPNADAFLDDVYIAYQIHEYSVVDLKVFALAKQATGNYEIPPGATPIRTIAQGITHLGGEGFAVWDGKSDSGVPVPDGYYGVAVSAKDSCGNENMRWVPVEVDNTPPTAAITYPGPSDPLANIVEIRGSADDLHFLSYTLEMGVGTSPGSWINITTGMRALRDNLLGTWNTYGLQGEYTLRLTARDTAGNQSVRTAAVNLDQRKTLIKDLRSIPGIFSPNKDGKVDTTVIKYELSDACGVQIEMLDSSAAVRKTYTTTTESAGTFTYVWNGENNSGATAPDGNYTIRLTATLASNPSVKQVENVSVALDTTSPLAEFQQPLNNSYFKTDVPVLGTIKDANLLEYSLSYSGSGAPVTIDQGGANRESYPFGTLVDLAEGAYILSARAKDAAENSARKDIAFTLDRTPPQVTLDTPKNGEYYGSKKSVINISGGVIEKNLDNFKLRYGPGNTPAAWNILTGSETVPTDPRLFTWNVGKESGIPDGDYTISLYAKDKVELEREEKVAIKIDNTPPAVSLVTPAAGDYVKTATEIKGTAADANLDKYTLEVSEGHCADAFKWATLKNSSTSVQNGSLLLWQALPPDGDYCLRLSAVDKVENKAEAAVQVKVDSHPPSPPVLSGKVGNKTNAALTWTASPEPDTSGYNLYRDSQKINTLLIQGLSYLDSDLKDGSYKYTVKAVDLAGNESKVSNEVTLKIDTKGPEAKIRSPLEGARVSGLIEIKGAAYSFDDFKEYRVSAGPGEAPSTWNLVTRSFVPTPYGLLAPWDTFILADGTWSIKLEAEDLSGNISTHQVSVTVDNAPPAAPVLLTAAPNGSDVTLTWRANTEEDLAGYLLFRNEQLANASGIVTGSLKPYLITGTTYINRGLPDGNHKYYLIAMDHAGNMSDQSNMLEVDIDVHPPHATFTAPLNQAKFESKTPVVAESPDLDIASVLFQFKKTEDSAWIDLGAPLTKAPYTTSFDPFGLGTGYGDYNLKVTATDKGGNVDPSPQVITVTCTDLTPPAAPANLKASVNGADVSLTWNANEEPDIEGYNIYRTSPGGGPEKVNASVVPEAAYLDTGLADGDYAYAVTAVDRHGNESEKSNSAPAKVYTPLVDQPYTPVGHQTITLSGSNAGPGNTVEIFADAQSGSGPVLRGQLSSDALGKFTLPALDLFPGENMITAVAKDGAGNTSKTSEPVYVVYNNPPAAPTGLTASVQDYNVALAWNPNSEEDLAGYNLYRNGGKLNQAKALTSGAASASFHDYDHPPGKAFDGDQDSYWVSYDWDGSSPAWWQLDLPSRELINRIELHWGSDSGNPDHLYAGKDFEIQAWSGHAWIPIAKVLGNTSKVSSLDFSLPYGTDKIRVHITGMTDESREVRLCEAALMADDLLTQTGYSDPGLHDGRYTYTVTAVDIYGFESEPASEPTNTAEVPVGDVIAPESPINLTAVSQGSSVLLNWNAVTGADLAGYFVYRKSGQEWTKVNGSPVSTPAYTDAGLLNGAYTYKVTAVDNTGNESAPSNEAQATVYVEPPHSPISLAIAAPPEGQTLVAAWQYDGAPVSGFTLYRSTAPGGPYAAVKSSLAEKSYTDKGLTNGVTYYYVVAARDAVGNESSYSNEASGTPADHVKPAVPSINYPAAPGAPVTVYNVATDVFGKAEPGVNVGLYRGGDFLGSATSLAQDSTRTIPPGADEYYGPPSPNGKLLTYTFENSLWIRDLRTDKKIRITENAYPIAWAPDLRRFFYIYLDENWNERTGIYDTMTGNHEALTDDLNVTEYYPSIPVDGSSIAFVSTRGGASDVWLKSLSGGPLTQLTSSGVVYSADISPDGKLLAYLENNNSLKLLNTGNLDVTEIVSGSTIGIIAWSPDGSKIVYEVSRNGYWDLSVFDIHSQGSIELTNIPDADECFPAWSPDSKSIAFISRDPSGQGSVYAAAASGQAETIPLALHTGYTDYLVWLKSGAVSYVSEGVLKIISFAGSYQVEDARLEPGENLLHAVARDSNGNSSEPSEQVSVTLAGGLIPDLAITVDDIFVYPPYPAEGDEVRMHVTVQNREQAAAGSFQLKVYLVSNGKSELLKAATVDSLPGGASDYISIDWDSAGKPGSYVIYAVADPEDKILEMSEANNFASREMIVTGQGGLGMTTRLDSEQYQAGQDVNIAVSIENSGEARDVALSVAVEDGSGGLTALMPPVSASLPYGTKRDVSFTWNTGTTFDGPYSVHAVLKDQSGALLFENIVPFAILPDSRLDASISTDKSGYASNENVAVAVGIANSGRNHIVAEINALIKISCPGGNLLFSEERLLTEVMPGTLNNLGAGWNTGLSSPGAYAASVDIVADGVQAPSKTTTFTIASDPLITGTIAALPSSVIYGGEVKLHYSLRNDGNAAVSAMPLKILIIDSGTGAVMNSGNMTADLPVGAGSAGDYTASTAGYRLRTYTAVLQGVVQGTARNIADTSFTVFDGIPPIVNIVKPSPGESLGSKVTLSAAASDDVSGVDKVEYRIDGGAWTYLPVADISSGRYSIAWNPVKADEGLHTISFRATDKAGNTSKPVAVNITIDLTGPAPPVILTPPDQSSVGTDTVDITGTAEPESTVSMAFAGSVTTRPCGANGRFTFPGVKLAAGWNAFKFTAADKLGNVSQATDYSLNFMAMASAIAVDKPKYNPLEKVVITSSLPNASSSGALTNISARVSVVNAQGQTVFTEETLLARIEPLQTATVVTNWNTGTNPKGEYSARLQALDTGGTISTAATAFTVLGTSETGEGLFGTIATSPATVPQGAEEAINWSVRNDGNEDLPALSITVAIINNADQAVAAEYTLQKALAKGAVAAETITVETIDLSPGAYSALLKASTSAMPEPRLLATTSFEVKPSLQASQSIPNVTNLLVWVNQHCHLLHKNIQECDPHDPHDTGCVRIDLLRNALRGAVTSYRIVYRKDDFQREMRNPYFTDYLIIGDFIQLEDRFYDELTEQVFAGKGLITSGRLKESNGGCSHDRPLTGVEFIHSLNEPRLHVDLVKSPISDELSLDVTGKAMQVEALSGTTVAGWMSGKKHPRNSDTAGTSPSNCPAHHYPAIVLNRYGEGKTVFFAFDFFSNLTEANFNLLSPVIGNSIGYVHKKTGAGPFLPAQLVPKQVTLTSSSSPFEVRLQESWPADLRVYDPLTSSWIKENPWTREAHVNPGSAKSLLSYILTPDKAGLYTLQTDAGCMLDGRYSPVASLLLDIRVAKDRKTAAADIVTALDGLSVSGKKDQAKLKSARQSVRNVQQRNAVSRHDMEKNIGDLLKAARNLAGITSCDVKAARLLIDRLLISWEAPLYLRGAK